MYALDGFTGSKSNECSWGVHFFGIQVRQLVQTKKAKEHSINFSYEPISQATSNGANIQWLSHLNVSLFEETQTWDYLREQAVPDHAPAQSYRPYSVSSFLVRRLDPHRLSYDECRHSDDLIGVLFLTRGWLKNDYGELLLSDSNGGVAASFMPYRGRVVFWQCDVPFHVSALHQEVFLCKYSASF